LGVNLCGCFVTAVPLLLFWPEFASLSGVDDVIDVEFDVGGCGAGPFVSVDVVTLASSVAF